MLWHSVVDVVACVCEFVGDIGTATACRAVNTDWAVAYRQALCRLACDDGPTLSSTSAQRCGIVALRSNTSVDVPYRFALIVLLSDVPESVARASEAVGSHSAVFPTLRGVTCGYNMSKDLFDLGGGAWHDLAYGMTNTVTTLTVTHGSLNSTAARRIGRHMRTLRHLTLRSPASATLIRSDFAELFNAGALRQQLESFELEGAPQLTAAWFDAVGRCPNLTAVVLSDLPALESNCALRAFAAVRCPALRSLTLRRPVRWNGDAAALGSLFPDKSTPSPIRDLCIDDRLHTITLCDEASLWTAAGLLPHLASLRITAGTMAHNAMSALLKNAGKSLTSLHFGCGSTASDLTLLNVAQECSQLQTLSLTDMFRIDDAAVMRFAQASGAPLTSLRITNCPNVSPAVAEGFFDRFSATLQELVIAGTDLIETVRQRRVRA